MKTRGSKIIVRALAVFWVLLLCGTHGYAQATDNAQLQVVDPNQDSSNLCRTYLVQPGDSALSIAQSFGIDYENLVEALKECINFEEGNFLQTGTKVCLPPYSTACKYVFDTNGIAGCKSYTVQMGDTLARIAMSFKLDMQALLEINSLKVSETVQAGQILKIPPWGDQCSKIENPVLEEVTCKVYSVKAGDTLASIAEEFEVSIGILKSIINDDDVQTGSLINVPLILGGCSDDMFNCMIHISSGEETLSEVASLYNFKSSDLLNINPELLTTNSEMEPGFQVKLPVWRDSCKLDEATVVNRGQASAAIQVPVTSNPVDQVPVTSIPVNQVPVTSIPVDVPSQTSEENIIGTTPNPPSEDDQGILSPSPFEDVEVPSSNASKLIFDATLGQIDTSEFSRKESKYIDAIARILDVSSPDIVVRFALPTTSLPRRLMSQSEMLSVNTAIFGNESSLYDVLLESMENGEMEDEMRNEGFNLLAVQVSYPVGEKTTLYPQHNGTEATEDSEGDSSFLSMGMIVGIAAGGAVLLLLALISCCAIRSCKNRRALEEREKSMRRQRNVSVNAHISYKSPDSKAKAGYGHAISAPQGTQAPIVESLRVIHSSYSEADKMINHSDKESSRQGPKHVTRDNIHNTTELSSLTTNEAIAPSQGGHMSRQYKGSEVEYLHGSSPTKIFMQFPDNSRDKEAEKVSMRVERTRTFTSPDANHFDGTSASPIKTMKIPSTNSGSPPVCSTSPAKRGISKYVELR